MGTWSTVVSSAATDTKTQGDTLRCSLSDQHPGTILFTQYGYGDNQDGSNGLRSYPLDYVFSGVYYWPIGFLYNQTLNTSIWSNSTASLSYAYRMVAWSISVNSAEIYSKSSGYSLRCVSRY